MAGYFEVICGITAVLLALYYYATSNFDFWKSRGVVGPRPVPIFGTSKDFILTKVSVVGQFKDVYDKYKSEPIVGLFTGRTPSILLNDPELIKDVLIRDFSKFVNRGTRIFEKTDPLSPHLFNLESEKWRPLRTKLSPIFTSGKLKEMFHLIIECAQHLEQYLEKQIENGEIFECRELTAKYTTDVIGSCAFGIDMNSLADDDSEFRRMGRKVFAGTLENSIRIKMRQFAPMLYFLLGYVWPERTFSPFFTKIFTDSIKYRKEHNVVRPDFVHLLMELQKHPDKLDNLELTDTLLTAQAFVFFAAGFETSSTTMSNALYELARNQDIQDKLREEIKEHCGKNIEGLKYEEIKRMEYLDKVFKETLRMYPPAGALTRKSVSPYTFSGTKVSIPENIPLFISVFGIHRDPDIYPNPDSFDPERFNEDAVAARHPMHYIPFGDGPRNCIGARFAVYQTKVGLITILRNHKVDVCEKTMTSYELDPRTVILCPKGGIYLKITKLSS